MSNIKYNEEQEAFELPYKLWGEMMTVRFYVESEQDIMDNLSSIAPKLEMLNGGKRKLSELAADEGYYEGDAESLYAAIELVSVYVDIDEDEVVVCFTITSSDGYMNGLNGELYDNEFELIGWN